MNNLHPPHHKFLKEFDGSVPLEVKSPIGP